MQDKKIIREMFQSFVQAWQNGKTDCLDDLLLPDCKIDFSIFDKGITREQLKENLAVRTRNVSYSRFELYNVVCCIGEDVAQQSGVVCGLFVDEYAEHPASFAFTARMVNTLIKTEQGWKYEKMRLELAGQSDNHARLYSTGVGVMWMKGDTSFIKNWRQIPLEVGWHEGSRLPSVIPETDAPWYAVQKRTDESSDEEKIKETIYRYCFGLDYDCVELYDEVFAENAFMIYGDYRRYDKRSVTEMLRFERMGGIGFHHVLYPTQIKIEGNSAKARVYRSGLDYIPGDKVIFGDDKNKNYLSGRYDMEFIKENGKWYIYRLYYYQGRIEGPRSEEVFYCSSEE